MTREDRDRFFTAHPNDVPLVEATLDDITAELVRRYDNVVLFGEQLAMGRVDRSGRTTAFRYYGYLPICASLSRSVTTYLERLNLGFFVAPLISLIPEPPPDSGAETDEEPSGDDEETF